MKYVIKSVVAGVLSILIAVFIVFLLKTFVGMPTTIKGKSMFPTLISEEKLLLSTWGATFNKIPDRGDCITFEAPSVDLIKNADLSNPVAIYNDSTKSFKDNVLYYALGIGKNNYIKRVIGIPGDHIEIKDGIIYLNEQPLEEQYINSAMKTDMSLGGEFSDIVVPDGYIYVLGDNRSSSLDSRRFGCIPVEKVEGKVWIRWWPFNKFGTV